MGNSSSWPLSGYGRIDNVNDEPKFRKSLPVHEGVDHTSDLPRSLRIDGLVVKCLDLTPSDLELMPQNELRDDFKCQEGWIVPDVRWRGVLLQTVFALARPHPEACHVQASAGGFSISLPLARANSALLAVGMNGKILPAEHGGPIRLVVTGGECFTSIKWLDHLELRSEAGVNTAKTIALARLSPVGGRDR